MRNFILSSALIIAGINGTVAQGLVRFSNITELGAVFQVGKTSRTVSYKGISGNEQTLESNPEAYAIPAPRIMTAFGVMVWDLVFLGAGAGYQFQFSEDPLPYQHNVTGFGQFRLHFAKGRFRPFTDLRLGYNYTLQEHTNNFLSDDFYKWDGLLIEPSLGMAFKLGGKALFNIGLLCDVTTREKQHRYQFLRKGEYRSLSARRLPSLLWNDVYKRQITRCRENISSLSEMHRLAQDVRGQSGKITRSRHT
jgi:hypothetical protein